jgi:hypothetical protein
MVSLSDPSHSISFSSSSSFVSFSIKEGEIGGFLSGFPGPTMTSGKLIGGLLQLSNETLWMACGNRWLIVDLRAAGPSLIRAVGADADVSLLSSSEGDLVDIVAVQLVENKAQREASLLNPGDDSHTSSGASLVQVWSCP